MYFDTHAHLDDERIDEDREELISMRSISASYQPQMDEGTRDALLAGWHEAVKRTLA